MTPNTTNNTNPLRLAVLLSGSGSNLQALLDAQHAGTLGAEVVVVASDRPAAYGIQRALDAGVPVIAMPLRAPRDSIARAAWETRLAVAITLFQPNLVLLAGFMRVLSPVFLDQFKGQVLNQHPALLPDGGGDTMETAHGHTIPVLRGAQVVADALRLSLPVTGCTVHWVTPVVDDGPVLARAEVPVLPSDDEATLHERIKQHERRLIVEVIRRLAAERR
jgi:phosphoribosylglycinamide formyltransferase 1